MSDDAPKPPSPDTGGLQFGKAEPVVGASSKPAACVTCSQPMSGSYYLLQAQKICRACHDAVAAGLAWKPGLKEYLKAVGLGFLAAIVGSLFYFIPLWFFKLEIGFVAIIVGAIVGVAVRRGSGGRGGLPFQLMAVFLTYCCIVVTYIPVALRDMPSSKGKAATATTAQPKGAADPVPAVEEPAESKAAKPVGCLGAMIGLVMLMAIAMALPILAGFENFLGWLIIGFALYEAWKINKRRVVKLSGPFGIPGGQPGAG